MVPGSHVISPWIRQSSHLGSGYVIEVETGFVLDYHVMSNFCQKCMRIRKKLGHNIAECSEEIARHKNDGECQQNYEGTAGGMEKEAALKMWNRSIENNGMRYSTIVSDDDSSAYVALVESDPYDGVPIKKEECVNHVGKRLGTRLRKLKKETLEEKVTKTGKPYKASTLGGRNKMTDAVINHLSNYYGNAIRSNKGKSVEEMKKACLSGFKHVTSTDQNPTTNTTLRVRIHIDSTTNPWPRENSPKVTTK